ncbi:FAD:protein FMN transferase [Ruminococcus sp.]|uniref:FAD:protein FMN transferase n=1 Tax=Ruminococcus sp. TaxID=41978 RepID=UPI0025ED5FA0|nr:FAD:protein FMN transferase [Ruminococcus sp.]
MSYKIIEIAALICILLTLGGCKSETDTIQEKTVSCTRDVFAMDTYMDMTAYGENAEQSLDDAENRILQLESELSATSETSEIWKIDHSNGNNVKMSDDTAEVIDQTLKMCEKTYGCLDITVYPVLKEWGFTTGDYKIPDKTKINKLLNNVGYSKVKTDSNNIQLDNDVQIDLGAVAKGYTGDKILDIMRSYEVESAIVNLGGNVQTLGKKPDGSDWKVAVRDPFHPETDMCVLEIADKAVITSGNYERFFIGEDGRRYCHIIDPFDGYPADNGYVSVTVIGSSGIICDALSTAVFVAGLDKASKIMKDFTDYDFIVVSEDEKIYYTDGISEHLKNVSSMPAEVIQID